MSSCGLSSRVTGEEAGSQNFRQVTNVTYVTVEEASPGPTSPGSLLTHVSLAPLFDCARYCSARAVTGTNDGVCSCTEH